jgi:hypothetical protein
MGKRNSPLGELAVDERAGRLKIFVPEPDELCFAFAGFAFESRLFDGGAADAGTAQEQKHRQVEQFFQHTDSFSF